jgi:hypothetical protein
MGFGQVEIVCAACGEEALLKRESLYEGFKKTGEALSCSACGHSYANEDEVAFKEKKRLNIFGDEDVPEKVNIFGDDDRSQKVDIFADDERRRNCRYCEHYVMNPFTQRCGLHDREVQATDCCPDFQEEKKEEDGQA